MAQAALSDGYVDLCIDPSANFYGEGCRILVEGQMLADGSATPNAVVCVRSDRDIAENFGSGSVIAEMLRKTLCTCPGSISVYALPRLDAADSVAAVYELTITGPALADGRIQLFLGEGSYNLDIYVQEGDTAATIAAAIVAEISDDFPYAATSAAGVVTLTAKNTGTIGNHLQAVYLNDGTCETIAPPGVTIAFDQTVVGAVDPVPDDYATVINECCFDVYALGSLNVAWQDNLRDHIRSAWACDKPQCFGHGYVANKGTVGQILATGDNSAELSRMAFGPTHAVLPYLEVAAYASLSACVACTNPEVSVQGPTYGTMTCILQPQSCAPEFTWPEVQQLQEQGFVVSGPSGDAGFTLMTNPMIFNDVTNYLYDEKSRPNATYRDASSRRLAKATAVSIAEFLQTFNGLGLYTRNTTLKNGTIGTTPRLILGKVRKWAQDNVGVLFSEFDNINNDIRLTDDFEGRPRCVGVPGVLHLDIRYRPPVRISKFNTNLVPALFDNCPRPF